MRRRGFTLIEMLVVIGIITALVAASLGGYSAMTRAAERTKCRELVFQVQAALETLYQREGNWPKLLATASKADGKLDAKTAYALRTYLSLNADEESKTLVGLDKFGIISPWAMNVFKRGGNEVTLDTQVNGPQKIKDHILHFALDLDGDGIIDDASVGGESVNVRAAAIVWCAGKDGKMEPYSKGLKRDDIYSWTPGQAKQVK